MKKKSDKEEEKKAKRKKGKEDGSNTCSLLYPSSICSSSWQNHILGSVPSAVDLPCHSWVHTILYPPSQPRLDERRSSHGCVFQSQLHSGFNQHKRLLFIDHYLEYFSGSVVIDTSMSALHHESNNLTKFYFKEIASTPIHFRINHKYCNIKDDIFNIT